MSAARVAKTEQWLPTLVFHQHPDAAAWATTIARDVSAALRAKTRPRLLVSGGSTPAPVFRELSQAMLDWASVAVALVDERWLPADDPDSNAHLVRENLLRGRSADARFELLAHVEGTVADSVAQANDHARQPADVVLLGMGDDGHTASLFPHMRDLDRALATTRAYVGIDASGCPGAGPWPQRISLTPAGMAPATTRLLLLRGDGKRSVLEKAAGGSDPHDFPVRVAFTTPGAILHVHWCP